MSARGCGQGNQKFESACECQYFAGEIIKKYV